MRICFGLILTITVRTKSWCLFYCKHPQMRIRFGLILTLQMRLRINKNTAWIDFQDYSADEILYASKIMLFYKNNPIHKRNYHSFQGSTPIIPASTPPSRECVAGNVFAIKKEIVGDFPASIEIIQHCGGNGRCTFSEIVLYTGD